MNDFILEAADVTNVSVSDIELTQLFAEAAVLEAMMDCYEKQLVLLEYNEESAEEIFIEMHQPETPESSTPATVAKKNLGNNIKKALSRAGAIIVKLFNSIMGAITSQKFQTLKKSLEKYEMGAEWYGPQLTDFELGYINHLQKLSESIDDATKYLEEARNVKTEKEANDLAKKIKKSAIEIIDKNIYKYHYEEEEAEADHTLTHAEMKSLCDYLTNKEIIGKLNNLRYNTAKWNTDYNWVDTVPPAVGDAIRTMVKNMMTAFKFISSGLNKIIKQEVDETKKTNKQVKKIMKEDKKAKKNKKNNDSDQTDENSSDDNLEESYSMNLSEDEDFF
jgi:hypothetical protein